MNVEKPEKLPFFWGFFYGSRYANSETVPLSWSSRSEVNLKVTGNYGSERTNLCKRSLESRDSNPPHHNTLESFMSRRVLRDRSKTYFYYFVYIKNNKNLYIYIMHTHTHTTADRRLP
uniref:Uncharacterized protein n=1 Tax=Cacopsylla melanoneura TaxID=428564 RepID=A0A8D8THR1_9HEMI